MVSMKHIIPAFILLLFGTACTTATFSVVRADKPIPIAEQLGLRPIDPTPIAVAFVNPDAPASNAKNVIETKDWTLTNAEYRQEDNVLEIHTVGSALSNTFSIPPGCYLFQFDQKAVPVPSNYRLLVTAGSSSAGFLYDTNCSPGLKHYWMTLGHFFRVSESENEMQISIKTSSYSGGGGYQGPSVQIRNLKIIPVQALLNLAPKGQPLQDIYWGENATSRTELTGEFLPLGSAERIAGNVYQFRLERETVPWSGYCPWEVEDPVAARGRADNKDKTFPPVPHEFRPIEKMIAQPQRGQMMRPDEMILKFEYRPVSICASGEIDILPPLRFLSANLEGRFGSRFGSSNDGAFWSTDGKTWEELSRPLSFPAHVFPCEHLYVKFVASEDASYMLHELRFTATLDTDQYADHGRTSYFRVVPGEAKESGMTINPLYTARNQVYFLYRNDTDKELQPEFSTRLRYTYTATFHDQMFAPPRAEEGRESGPQEVIFRAIGNTVEAFDDITCHWEVLGDSDKIPPGEERICVFTLETSKLRSSAHFQRGPFVSDVFDVEFDLGTYKMLNEQMRFFPPRLAIE